MRSLVKHLALHVFKESLFIVHTGSWPILWISALNMMLLLDCIKFVHPEFGSSFIPLASRHSWAVCCRLVVQEEAVLLSFTLEDNSSQDNSPLCEKGASAVVSTWSGAHKLRHRQSPT